MSRGSRQGVGPVGSLQVRTQTELLRVDGSRLSGAGLDTLRPEAAVNNEAAGGGEETLLGAASCCFHGYIHIMKSSIALLFHCLLLLLCMSHANRMLTGC